MEGKRSIRGLIGLSDHVGSRTYQLGKESNKISNMRRKKTGWGGAKYRSKSQMEDLGVGILGGGRLPGGIPSVRDEERRPELLRAVPDTGWIWIWQRVRRSRGRQEVKSHEDLSCQGSSILVLFCVTVITYLAI